jgi:lipopolysaccharide transport system permease protein
MQQEEDWSNIISSRTTFSFHSLKDVWHYRDLLWMFVKRDIVTNYKQTVLGPLWFVIQPVLTTLMYVIIFNRVANIETPCKSYFILLIRCGCLELLCRMSE